MCLWPERGETGWREARVGLRYRSVSRQEWNWQGQNLEGKLMVLEVARPAEGTGQGEAIGR